MNILLLLLSCLLFLICFCLYKIENEQFTENRINLIIATYSGTYDKYFYNNEKKVW